jgi:uncharacterized repeat protein (TIGR01451 family)
MTSSARTAAANGGLFCGLLSGRAFFVMLALLALTLPAAAQTAVNPPTNTILFSGQDANSVNTGPLGGIVLQGSAISVFTGLPVRHLWVADTFSSICRMDPELGAPGPYDINRSTCAFSVLRGGGAIPLGGQMAYDPGRNWLYYTDNNTASMGVVRVKWDPTADSGHGLLDFSNGFTLAGGFFARKGPFIGGTGCPYPGPAARRALPNGAVLDPLGNLWVGFADGGEILRINSPGTAAEFGFGSCDQFVQLVATSPDGAITNGLAFIGHDLWSGDGTSPFVIHNADTTCLVPPNAACTTANGTVVPTLAAVGATNALESDQKYPATNGNNLYFGAGAQIAWVGNASAPTAAQTLDVTYLNTGALVVNPPLAAISAMGVDTTDPANQVVYSAEDPIILINPLAIGNARWWQTTQPPAAPAAPGVPLNVVAVAGNAQISLSWSPDQVAQQVTSYTVRNSFISSGAPIADITVNPGPGGVFPPTSIVIPATNGVSYAFEVAASNANGTSAFSAQSNIVTPPGLSVPSTPGPVTAQAGDTQALVTWTVSSSAPGTPITSYTVTSNPGGLTVTVPPPAFGSNTQSVVFGGLTNGTAYTFTVHATNIAGDSAESAPSNSVTPSAAFLPTVSATISKPLDPTSTPAQLTFTITVTNTSKFPATNINVTDTLNTIPANISLITRDATGLVTVSTTTTTQFAPNMTVVVAGVTDPSFNGTFTIVNTPTTSTFTFQQPAALGVASSSLGTATLQPLANVISIQTGQGTCTAAGPGVVTFSCNIGELDPGAVVRIPFIVQMQNQSITNSVVVSGTDFAGTSLAPSSTSVTTNAPTFASTTTTTDLQVSGSAANGGPTVTGTLPTGAPDSYRWQIRNATAIPANNVVFTQTMPASLVFQSVTTDLPADLGLCSGPAPGTAGGTVTCNSANLGGSRKNGAKPVQQFNVTVNVNVVQTGSIPSTGTVTFTGTDSNPKNNSVIVTINAK